MTMNKLVFAVTLQVAIVAVAQSQRIQSKQNQCDGSRVDQSMARAQCQSQQHAYEEALRVVKPKKGEKLTVEESLAIESNVVSFVKTYAGVNFGDPISKYTTDDVFIVRQKMPRSFQCFKNVDLKFVWDKLIEVGFYYDTNMNICEKAKVDEAIADMLRALKITGDYLDHEGTKRPLVVSRSHYCFKGVIQRNHGVNVSAMRKFIATMLASEPKHLKERSLKMPQRKEIICRLCREGSKGSGRGRD